MSHKPSEIHEGSRAPIFSLQGTTGRVSLTDFLGNGNVLLYFVREFGCHTCMQRAITLAKIQDEMSLTQTKTLLIGGGDFDMAQKVANRYKLNYPVLADPKRDVYGQYGFDRSMLIIQKSGVVLIDRQGYIRYVHRSANPGDGFDRQEVLSAASKLNKPAEKKN